MKLRHLLVVRLVESGVHLVLVLKTLDSELLSLESDSSINRTNVQLPVQIVTMAVVMVREP